MLCQETAKKCWWTVSLAENNRKELERKTVLSPRCYEISNSSQWCFTFWTIVVNDRQIISISFACIQPLTNPSTRFWREPSEIREREKQPDQRTWTLKRLYWKKTGINEYWTYATKISRFWNLKRDHAVLLADGYCKSLGELLKIVAFSSSFSVIQVNLVKNYINTCLNWRSLHIFKTKWKSPLVGQIVLKNDL